ncbi:neurotrophin 1-like [Palaemon carinicauda]|uniref:neurotrophin 1-like n=1 Tax=Palaemon carinicauda TaxID=392227 RepID=UPI0035B5B81A
MSLRLLVLLAAVAAAAVGQHSSSYPRSSVSYGSNLGHQSPAYHPQPSYQPSTPYQQRPHKVPSPNYPRQSPACATKSNKPWCLEDEEYPTYNITHAANHHSEKLLTLYADVADLNTALSVNRPKTLKEETYLCPSKTSYVKPLRAQNTEGVWRIIINNIDVHYKKLTQTVRIEECLTAGDDCPKVPKCYDSKCLQKSVYHRFLVFDPYDAYFPFAIESFKLPASCACLLGAYTIDH